MWRTGTPDWRSADSNVNEQPRRNATKSSRHSRVMSETSAGEAPVAVDPILRDVRPQVGADRDADGLGVAGIGHLDQRTRPGVPLTEDEEVVRLRLGQDHEVRLHVAGGKPGRAAGVAALADGLPDLLRRLPELHRVASSDLWTIWRPLWRRAASPATGAASAGRRSGPVPRPVYVDRLRVAAVRSET